MNYVDGECVARASNMLLIAKAINYICPEGQFRDVPYKHEDERRDCCR